jgi:phage shock protein A
MRLIQHTADLIAANLNHLLDRLEQPEAMLKHRLAQSEDQIRHLSVLVARSIAAEQLLSKQVAEHRRRSERCALRARRALAAGDDSAARQVLGEQWEHDRAVCELAEPLNQAGRHNERLRGNLRQLQARQAIMRQRFAAWSAKAQLHPLACGAASPAAALDRALEQCHSICGQLERVDRETDALIELNQQDLIDERTSERDSLVEDELARLRREIGAGGQS